MIFGQPPETATGDGRLFAPRLVIQGRVILTAFK
jgi:hypothetical protein